MLSNTARFFLIIVTLLVLDGIYLSQSLGSYSKVLSQIQKSPVNLNYFGAFLAYTALVIAAYVLTSPGSNLEIPWVKDILPRLTDSSSKDSQIYGTALIFFTIYLCYNGTNLATFSEYTLPIAAQDTIWGTLLGFMTSFVVVYMS
jgi:uncharacterized membrane protein